MSQDTESKIIETAVQLFMAQGYKQTTTKQLAELAGVNESTIFRTFGNKEALFHQAIDYAISDLIRIDNEGLTYGKDLEQDLYLLLQKGVLSMKKAFPSFRLLVKRELLDEAFLNEVNTKLGNLQVHFRQYLTGLQKRGLIRELDFEALVDFLFGAIFHEAICLSMEETDNGKFQDSLDAFCQKYARYCCSLLILEQAAADKPAG